MQNAKYKIKNSNVKYSINCNVKTEIRTSGFTGFTLLEIMIALAIIAATVSVILHTVNYHADVMHDNITTTEMYQAAKEKMHALEKTRKNSKGSIKSSDLTYENLAIKSEDSNIVELKTYVRGHDKEILINEFVLKKAENDLMK